MKAFGLEEGDISVGLVAPYTIPNASTTTPPLPPAPPKQRGFTFEISSGWQQTNMKKGTDLILVVNRNSNNNKLHNNNKKLHNNNNSSSNCSDNIDSDNNLYLLWYTSETKGCTGCRSVKLRTCSQYWLSVINK